MRQPQAAVVALLAAGVVVVVVFQLTRRLAEAVAVVGGKEVRVSEIAIKRTSINLEIHSRRNTLNA